MTASDRLRHLGVQWISNADKAQELEIGLCGRHGCQRSWTQTMSERQHSPAFVGEAFDSTEHPDTPPPVEWNGLHTLAHSCCSVGTRGRGAAERVGSGTGSEGGN